MTAALDILLERGFEGTTLESVAESLGYTKPALYYYFKSKEELFSSLILNALTDSHEKIKSICSRNNSAGEKLKDLIRLYLDDGVQSRGYFTITHMLKGFKERMPEGPDRAEIERLSADIPQLIIGIMRQGIDSGEFRKEDPKVLGGIVFAMLSGVLIHLDMPVLSGADHERIKSSLDEIIVKGITS